MVEQESIRLSIRRRLISIAQQEIAGLKGGVEDDALDEWTLDSEIYQLAFKLWFWMKATDYKFLPYAGGLAEQPDRLMSEIAKIAWQYEVTKNHVKANAGGFAALNRNDTNAPGEAGQIPNNSAFDASGNPRTDNGDLPPGWVNETDF